MSSDARPADAELGAPQAPSHPLDTGIVGRALREPGHALTVAMAIIKGRLFTWWAKAFRPRVIIGRGLRIYGTLYIRGSGTVVLGNQVEIHGRVTPWTNRSTARIRVGDRTKLDGTRFSCVQSIDIGSDCLLANCRILDTSFHPTARGSTADARTMEAPVTVGRNVWISLDAGLLPGTCIGDNSVVAMAAICKGEYPAGVMILGNPARVAGRLS